MTTGEMQHAADKGAADGCRFRRSSSSRDLNQHVKMFTDWEQRYDQLSRGCFEGQLTEAWVGNIQIFEERMSQAVFQTGIGRADTVSLGVFSSLPGKARWQGVVLGMDHVTSLNKDNTLELCTPRDCVMLGVSVPVSMFATLDAQLPDGGLKACLQGLPSAHVLSPSLAALIRQRLTDALLVLTCQPMQLAQVEARKQLSSEIVGLVDEYVGAALLAGAVPFPAKARRVVALAREYIEQHPDRPITVLDLCQQTFTSRRTLQYCFEQVVGMSPAAYLKVLRLNSLRRELVATRGATTIGDLAARWGFWHLSQFSLDYKRLFGELPSETLRRSACH